MHGDELWAYDPSATVTIQLDSQPDHVRNVRYNGSAGISADLIWTIRPLMTAMPSATTSGWRLPLAPMTLQKRQPAGWFLTAIACDAPGATVDLANRKVALTVTAGHQIQTVPSPINARQ